MRGYGPTVVAALAMASAAVADSRPTPPVEHPIPVAADAPMGTSGQIASGAAVGVAVGIFVLLLAFSTAD